ncbi:hypothetical protein EPA93_04075 [Ktedonosporobacter rubrisoli]|uniref:Uncharacterized protein n=1 Tax=Ktedonosporobacter rubrisoli TaxID=2509675 RepID=A0A4P6JJC9_KTERU|nr:hypothetical protein [Ktedonosporobacter rubrisoli]QBD75214.1 hypothetical protein EPA93_04075 [Ktedonosporobacter rubrisoli]
MQQENTQLARKRILQYLIWFHFAINVLHTVTHIGAGVMHIPLFQTVYAVGVIMLAPFIALIWLPRSLRQAAGILVCILIASFIFGFLNHLLLPGADLVSSVTGMWALPFQLSAYLVLLTEIAGIGLCFWIIIVSRPNQLRSSAPGRKKQA